MTEDVIQSLCISSLLEKIYGNPNKTLLKERKRMISN